MNKSSGRRLTNLDRQHQCLQLRLRGISYFEIGIRVGISKVQACRLVRAAIQKRRDRDLMGNSAEELLARLRDIPVCSGDPV